MPVQTPNIFAPTSTPAITIRDLSWFVLGICAVICVGGGLLTYSVTRFRRRPGEDSREPPLTPFRYFDTGNMSVVGRNFAIIESGRLRLNGFVAWLAWAAMHIAFLPQAGNRVG